MQKFIVRLALFAVCCFLILILLEKFDNRDRNYNGDHNVIKITHISDFDSLNILFVGNSYCYSSIASPLFDSLHSSVFNLGVATAGVRFYSLLIDNYLSSLKRSPDTIMLLLSPMTFSPSQADNWREYPIHRYFKEPLSNENVVLKYHSYQDYLPMLFNSCRKCINNLFAGRKPDSSGIRSVYMNKGFYIDSSVTSDSLEKVNSPLYLPLKKDVFPVKDGKEILDLAARLTSKGIKVIFFAPPTNKLDEYFSSDFLVAYQTLLNEISKRYLVIDNHIKLEKKYYRNTDHINTPGAYIYTKYLINKLYEK